MLSLREFDGCIDVVILLLHSKVFLICSLQGLLRPSLCVACAGSGSHCCDVTRPWPGRAHGGQGSPEGSKIIEIDHVSGEKL